jgi:hypothetical protein
MHVTAKFVKLVVLSVLTALSASCGEFTRQGRSPVIMVIDRLEVGDAGTLLSDVVQLVTTPAPCSDATPCQVVMNDMADVTLRLVLKDPGTPGALSEPSDLNSVTVTRYRVEYRRTDGRGTQGVDVPYGFDSAVTFNIPGDGSTDIAFEIVRHAAKLEAPLMALRSSGNIISTIASVTFYGRDLAGNDISASANIGVNFGNFADELN